MWLTVFQCSLLLISSMWSIYHKKVRLTVMLGELFIASNILCPMCGQCKSKFIVCIMGLKFSP